MPDQTSSLDITIEVNASPKTESSMVVAVTVLRLELLLCCYLAAVVC
jgi:hypothetical protein